jgi:hypothetical protein
MKTFITKVNSTYGAPMGRHTGAEYLDSSAGKVYLRQVPLDTGGYDRGGAYWGIGQTLWETLDQDGNGFIFRSRDRSTAKSSILDIFPDVKFYN